MRATGDPNSFDAMQYWRECDLDVRACRLNRERFDESGDNLFLVHDGPPYANGSLHLGHVMNKVVKDALMKYKRLQGFYCPYVPGWDCHGLPIELKVLSSWQEQGKTFEAKDAARLRADCRVYANTWVEKQLHQFQSLGVFAEWSARYSTMDRKYEADTLRVFGKLVGQGCVEYKLMTVPWCTQCHTTLSKAEMEYQVREDSSCYVGFALTPDSLATLRSRLGALGDACQLPDSARVLVTAWTTTPGTLPLNQAVVLSPVGDYVVVQLRPQVTDGTDGQPVYAVLGADEYRTLRPHLNVLESESVGDSPCTVPSKTFAGLRCYHPLTTHLCGEEGARTVPVLFDNLVERSTSQEQADKKTDQPKDFVCSPTGVLHLAPSCGPDDYRVGLAHNLSLETGLDENGCYRTSVYPAALSGLCAGDAATQERVLEMVRQDGRLVLQSKVSHDYPHCWRCKKGLVFRPTEQWFCSLHKSSATEANTKDDLVSRAAHAVGRRVSFFPRQGRAKFLNMLNEPHEWCLSRQRYWGVPVVALHCLSCGDPYSTEEMVDTVANKLEDHGLEYWWGTDCAELKPCCPRCGNSDAARFRKETDVLDVWFDSGASFYHMVRREPHDYCVPGQREGSEHVPPRPRVCDLYFEGRDQHRGWFQSSLLCSMVSLGQPGASNEETVVPFANLLTHGFLVDEKGRKVSKSEGNGMTYDEFVLCCGGNMDLARLWACTCDWTKDMKCTKALVTQLGQSYRQVRGLFRFLLANLADFALDYVVPVQSLAVFDQCVLAALTDACDGVLAELKKFDLCQATQSLLAFCQNLSSLYIERAKMDLYFLPAHSPQRRAVQTTCHHLFTCLVRYLAPCFAFMAEEAYQEYETVLAKNATSKVNSNDSAHVAAKRVASVHLQSFAGLVQWRWSDVLDTLRERGSNDDSGSEKVNGGPFASLSVEGLQSLWKDLMGLRKKVNVVLERGRKERLYNDEKQNRLELVFSEDDSKDRLLYHFLGRFPDNLALCDFFLVSEFAMSLQHLEPQSTASGKKDEHGAVERVKACLLTHTQCHRCRRYLVPASGSEVKTNLCNVCVTWLGVQTF